MNIKRIGMFSDTCESLGTDMCSRESRAAKENPEIVPITQADLEKVFGKVNRQFERLVENQVLPYKRTL